MEGAVVCGGGEGSRRRSVEGSALVKGHRR